MDVRQIEERMRAIVADELGIDPATVTREKRFRDLGADSLDSLSLTVRFDNEFDIEISDDEADRTMTFGEAVELVSGKVRTAPQPV